MSTSPKRLARVAGVLYLLVGIFGGFAEGYVEPKMYVAGNAAATAGNVIASYLADFLVAFLLPDLAKAIHGFASILPAIAEPSMVLYLVVVGVKTPKPPERVLVAA